MIGEIFEKNTIYEGILSYYYPANKPTAAPMGFKLVDDDEIEIKVYRESYRTYHSLISGNTDYVINLTLNLKLFLKSAFKYEFGELEHSIFTKSPYINAPRITNCYGYIDVRLRSIEKYDNYLIANFKIINIEVKKIYFIPTRAFTQLLEAIIYMTKVKTLKNHKDIVEKVLHSLNIVKKVSNSNYYNNLVETIYELLRMWRLI